MPPRRGLTPAESARASTSSTCRSDPTPAECRTIEPPGKGRAAHLRVFEVLVRWLPAPAPEEAEQGEDEHDDQDDPEKAHVVSFWLSTW
jgi:hypothetical protein